MQIEGLEIKHVSEKDGLPFKTKLPGELKDRLKTKKQWLEEGRVVKEGAAEYEMHPSLLAERTFVYFLDTDAETINGDRLLENCTTCAIRIGRYCVVAGDYVGEAQRCSEWSPRRS